MDVATQKDTAQALPVVRTAVRDLLSSSQAFHNLTPEDRKAAVPSLDPLSTTMTSPA